MWVRIGRGYKRPETVIVGTVGSPTTARWKLKQSFRWAVFVLALILFIFVHNVCNYRLLTLHGYELGGWRWQFESQELRYKVISINTLCSKHKKRSVHIKTSTLNYSLCLYCNIHTWTVLAYSYFIFWVQ